MADYKYLVIFVLVIITPTRCFSQHPIHKKVEELNNLSKEMYGEVRKGNTRENFNVVDELMYPRGDRRKLAELSKLWRDYYTCSAGLLKNLTATRQTPAVMIMVYQGAVARLPCTSCVAPDEIEKLIWMYAKSSNTNFTQIEDHERLTIVPGKMAILYNVMPDDAGVYSCAMGASVGGLVVLEVVDEEEAYTIVKPPSSRGPLAVDPELYRGVILFSQWTSWSECSVCGKLGRRHRYGMCYVKLHQSLLKNYANKNMVGPEGRGNFIDLDNEITGVFKAFPDGVPCRSEYLPSAIKSLDGVQQRPSEIMIGMCKVHCQEIPSKNKLATNATGGRIDPSGTLMYSLAVAQVLPKQPPLSGRNTMFADIGQEIAIRCPGTTLRDVPILWRIGTKHLVPRDIDKGSGGRVHMNSRDHLVFTKVQYKDANLYSCWQWGNLAGTVKLIVWEGAHARWNHHVTLVIVVIITAIVLRAVELGVRNIQRRQSILYHLK